MFLIPDHSLGSGADLGGGCRGCAQKLAYLKIILGRTLNIKLKVSEKAMGVLLLYVFYDIKSSKFNVRPD